MNHLDTQITRDRLAVTVAHWRKLLREETERKDPDRTLIRNLRGLIVNGEKLQREAERVL